MQKIHSPVLPHALIDVHPKSKIMKVLLNVSQYGGVNVNRSVQLESKFNNTYSNYTLNFRGDVLILTGDNAVTTSSDPTNATDLPMCSDDPPDLREYYRAYYSIQLSS